MKNTQRINVKNSVLIIVSIFGIVLQWQTASTIKGISIFFYYLIVVAMLALVGFNFLVQMIEKKLSYRMAVQSNIEIQKRVLDELNNLALQNEEADQRAYKSIHDVNNHLTVILTMLKEYEVDQVNEYIMEMKKRLKDEVQ